MNGQHLLAVLLLTPASRVSGCARLLGVWHTRSDRSCVKHGPRRRDVCLDWLLAVLGWQGCFSRPWCCREGGQKVLGWGQAAWKLSCHLQPPRLRECDHGQILATGTNERLYLEGWGPVR